MVHRSTRSRLSLVVLGALTLPLLLTGAGCQPAADITVTTTQDELNNDGDCSLREAVQAANTDSAVDACAAGSGPDIIAVPAGTYRLTKAGTHEQQNLRGDLDILSVLTLRGANRQSTIIDGAGLDRELDVFGGAAATVTDLTLRNGLAPPSRRGGAIVVLVNGTLNLTRVDVTGNATATGNDGSTNLHAPDGGGIYVDGTANLTDTTVTGNTAGGGEGSGGGIWNSGTINLLRTTVRGNQAQGGSSSGGDIDGGGGLFSSGAAALNQSTIDGNTSNFRGGGIANEGTSLTIVNSTISGNSGTVGGGIYTETDLTATNATISTNSSRNHGGGIWTLGDTRLRNSTLALNVADSDNNGSGDGGGFLIFFPGQLFLRNSVVNQNSDLGGQAPNCSGFGNLRSEGYNKIGSTNSCTFLGDMTGNIIGGNAMLGPLQDNGGATATHALLPGSPALDAGNPAAPGSGGTSCPTTDQRGLARPTDGNGDGTSRCDMGAFEVQP